MIKIYSVVHTTAVIESVVLLRLGIPAGKKWTIKEIRGSRSDGNMYTVLLQVAGNQTAVYDILTDGIPIIINEEYDKGTEIIIQGSSTVAVAQRAAISMTIDEHD